MSESDHVTVCEFVFRETAALHGPRFLIARHKSAPPRHECGPGAATLRHYNLKGVREDSRLGLLGWLEARYPLDLRWDIPTPRNMLEAQCHGRRFVSMLSSEQTWPIGRHAGPFEFLLHDLEHAHKFFGGEFHGQVKFFNLLRRALDRDLFSNLDPDPQFARELDYLMSDMNSHPVHLLKYLKAVVLCAYRRRGVDHDRLLDQWAENLFATWELPVHVFDSAMRINRPREETEMDRLHVSLFFSGRDQALAIAETSA